MLLFLLQWFLCVYGLPKVLSHRPTDYQRSTVYSNPLIHSGFSGVSQNCFMKGLCLCLSRSVWDTGNSSRESAVETTRVKMPLAKTSTLWLGWCVWGSNRWIWSNNLPADDIIYVFTQQVLLISTVYRARSITESVPKPSHELRGVQVAWSGEA